MTVTVRLTEEEKELFESHAEIKQVSLSELFRLSVLEQIEDEIDIADYWEAMQELKKKPITYSHNEVFGDVL